MGQLRMFHGLPDSTAMPSQRGAKSNTKLGDHDISKSHNP